MPQCCGWEPGAGRRVRWSCRGGGTWGTAHSRGESLAEKGFGETSGREKRENSIFTGCELCSTMWWGQNMEWSFWMLSNFCPRRIPILLPAAVAQGAGSREPFGGETCRNPTRPEPVTPYWTNQPCVTGVSPLHLPSVPPSPPGSQANTCFCCGLYKTPSK